MSSDINFVSRDWFKGSMERGFIPGTFIENFTRRFIYCDILIPFDGLQRPDC